MLLSNKRVKVVMPIAVITLVLTAPPLTCSDKEKQVIEIEKEYTALTVTNTPHLCSGVSLTLSEIL